MARAMKLDQALKLYIALYFLCFFLTWFISVPMLLHVGTNSECLLFVTPRVVYGPSAACIVVGVIPLIVALAAIVLITLHIVQLRSLKNYLRKPGPHSSKDFHNRPIHIFWRMVVLHAVVTLLMVIATLIMTAGYGTTCANLELEVKQKVRARVSTDRFGGGDGIYEVYDRYQDSRSIQRYVNPTTNVWGNNIFEQGITCRTILTDVEITRMLKEHHESNPLFRRYYGFYDRNFMADVGNIHYLTYRDNLSMELCLAGCWISLLLWVVILILMVTLRHQIKAHLTDESMWGSEYGSRSHRSSRMSNHSFDTASRISAHSASRVTAPRSQSRALDRSSVISSRGYEANNDRRGNGAGGRSNGMATAPVTPRTSMGPRDQPNASLLAYFSENPPVEDEVDLDAVYQDKALEDSVPVSYSNHDPNPTMMANNGGGTYSGHHVHQESFHDNSFGSEGLPVPMDSSMAADPLPMGDDVSAGRLREMPITQPLAQQGGYNPNRVTGRRGGRQGRSSSRPELSHSLSQEPYMDEIQMTSQYLEPPAQGRRGGRQVRSSSRPELAHSYSQDSQAYSDELQMASEYMEPPVPRGAAQPQKMPGNVQSVSMEYSVRQTKESVRFYPGNQQQQQQHMPTSGAAPRMQMPPRQKMIHQQEPYSTIMAEPRKPIEATKNFSTTPPSYRTRLGNQSLI